MAAGRHNLTRRALLGAVFGACALPSPDCASATAGGSKSARQRGAWARALAAFRRAKTRLASLDAGAPDDLSDDLECARLAALRRLMQAPAPDLHALSLKIDLAVDEDVATLTGAEACLAVLKADARRLAYGG